MDEQLRYTLERSHEQIRSALALLPKKKDPRITLAREFLGADEEGPAFDVLLIVGEAQEAGDEFWAFARQAAVTLDANDSAAWLSAEAQAVCRTHGFVA